MLTARALNYFLCVLFFCSFIFHFWSLKTAIGSNPVQCQKECAHARNGKPHHARDRSRSKSSHHVLPRNNKNVKIIIHDKLSVILSHSSFLNFSQILVHRSHKMKVLNFALSWLNRRFSPSNWLMRILKFDSYVPPNSSPVCDYSILQWNVNMVYILKLLEYDLICHRRVILLAVFDNNKFDIWWILFTKSLCVAVNEFVFIYVE